MNAQIRPAAAPEQAQDRLLWHDARTGRSGAGGLDLLPQLLAPGDVLVLNDAATIPGSLRAETLQGQELEVRLIVRDGPGEWTVALFGAGDWRTPTEHRPEPPPLAIGDQLVFPGPIRAELIAQRYGIARLVQLRFDAGPGVLSHTLFGRGRPVQYSYLARELEVAEVQTPYASAPWAVEMPSAGRPLSWRRLRALRHRGVEIASLTHAAGLSSTGDAELDARLAREARITACLDHPGIVPIFDAGTGPDGRVYYTMPIVRGRSLAAGVPMLNDEPVTPKAEKS